jgi:hypothetical protein
VKDVGSSSPEMEIKNHLMENHVLKEKRTLIASFTMNIKNQLISWSLITWRKMRPKGCVHPS